MLQPMTVLLSEPSKPDNRSSYLSKAANHVIFVIHASTVWVHIFRIIIHRSLSFLFVV